MIVNSYPSNAVNVISSKKIYPILQQKSNKKSKQYNQERQEIIYVDKAKEVETVGTKSHCNCQVLLCGSDYQLCRCGPEILWILFLCLVVSLTLAALIIPIVVGLSGVQPTGNACGVTYSQYFSGGGVTTQCAAWNTFLGSLNCSTYRKLHIYGSNDGTGIIITDSTVATALVIALRTGGTYTGFSNGYLMKVGSCTNAEITTSGTVCNCNTGYTLRPCNPSWGGIACSYTCGAVSQWMSLSVE